MIIIGGLTERVVSDVAPSNCVRLRLQNAIRKSLQFYPGEGVQPRLAPVDST